MKKVVKHIINRFAFVWFFLTKANFLSSFEYGVGDKTATVFLPGTRFAELLCKRNGCKPIRFQVGALDSSTEVLGIDTGAIELRCGDKQWTSSISAFVAGLHFSRA